MMKPFPHRVRGALAVLTLCALGLAGCADPQKTDAPLPAAPPPTFTGPAFLHGTVASLARLRGYEPMLVSGYGIVVNLPGTGSSEVPAFMRRWLLNEMQKRGVGSARLGTEHMSPQRLLASKNTAVVAIEALIPPGASAGSTFDVLVTAMPQTQTTSLQGGQLWTTDLSLGGLNPAINFGRKHGEASGPIYVNPFDERAQDIEIEASPRAMILSGGRVTLDRQIELILNQPSWERSRAIADRINERFPMAANERGQTAVAKSDMLIELHPPQRYQGNPERLLALVSRLYIQRGFNFEPQQAQRLAEVLIQYPQHEDDVVDAWEALGKTTLPVLRTYYDHSKKYVQLAALRAGARLGDGLTTQTLEKLAKHDDPIVRKQTAMILQQMPSNLHAARILRSMVDDDDRNVRIAAYEAMASANDPTIKQRIFATPNEKGQLSRTTFKFVLDLVPSEKSLIYVNQQRVPRIAIFGPDTGFVMPMVARLWDNQIMIKGGSDDTPLEVFFQPYNGDKPKTFRIAPRLGNLIYLLAHRASSENPAPGMDLSYSQVVNAIYTLREQGHIDAELDVRISPLAKALVRYKDAQTVEQRPDGAALPQYAPESETNTAPRADAAP